ncbi:MAG: O-antigen translocase [Alphaproteobacteria bacterium]|nr:O-antigen translocase [Alphaproteobacteria bacterium]
MTEKHTYHQIIRSSSIIGGAQVANYIIGLLRTKLVAMWLGPSGVGLIGLYASAIGLAGVVSSLGVNSSGVREVVRASSKEDIAEVARTVIILRRVCWATGLLGWVVVAVLSEPISSIMTGSPQYARTIAALGSLLLLGAISGGQLAVLQGLRRVGDLARANVLGALLGSIVSVSIYYALGEAGIVPAMIASAVAVLGCSYWFAQRVSLKAQAVSWAQTRRGFNRLIGLGLAFMWAGVAGACLEMFTRSMITRKFGIEAVGIYQAAWALSGVFASFVLTAMGTDFYPRLTAIIHDHAKAARAVNEQTEIGILLALPGLLAVLAFAPLAIKILYTSQFLPAAGLLPWMALGVFGRVVSWPLGYIQLAVGDPRWYAATETIFNVLWALLIFVMVERSGVIGAAYASAAIYGLHVPASLWVSRVLIGFSWSREARKLIMISTCFIIVAFVLRFLVSDITELFAGGLLTLAGALFCLRGLAKRLGEGHSVIRWCLLAPGARFLLTSGTIPKAL